MSHLSSKLQLAIDIQSARVEKSGHQEGRVTAKIDLTDLFDMFAKTEEKPPIDPPISPEARRWRANFTTNVEAVLRVRDIPRVEAERVAFENTVTTFLDANRPDTDPNRCAHCGSSERPNELRPMGGGARHSWVHNGCWPDWFARRRADAIAELAAMGIVSP
jgi:hypothetical protein